MQFFHSLYVLCVLLVWLDFSYVHAFSIDIEKLSWFIHIGKLNCPREGQVQLSYSIENIPQKFYKSVKFIFVIWKLKFFHSNDCFHAHVYSYEVLYGVRYIYVIRQNINDDSIRVLFAFENFHFHFQKSNTI